MNGQTCQIKGKVTASPRAKAKVKARATENIQEKGTTTGQRTLSDFGKNVKELNLSVMSKRKKSLRVPVWIEQPMCFAFKSATMDPTELPSSSKRVSDGNGEPAGTHEKFDQSTGEVLFAVGCRDDRPIVGSGSVVSTCPVDYATSVPTEKVQYRVNLESVLGESLQHYGIKCNVPFTNRCGSSMNVNFEVANTKRAILSVHKGCGNGSMVVFTPDRKVKLSTTRINCIVQVKQIMASTPGFDIVYDRRAYVLDVDVNDGVYVNNERQQFEHNSGKQFSCHSRRVLGTSFEPSKARSRTTAPNSTRCSW